MPYYDGDIVAELRYWYGREMCGWEKLVESVMGGAAAEIDRLREEGKRAASLFEAIEHGDNEHRAWLREAIDNHLAGKPVPTPRGKGTAKPD